MFGDSGEEDRVSLFSLFFFLFLFFLFFFFLFFWILDSLLLGVVGVSAREGGREGGKAEA